MVDPVPLPLPSSTSGYGADWLVIPLYNEVSVIANVIAAALSVFPNIVCVDDGSTDGSADAARAAGARVLSHAVNLGQGDRKSVV